MTLILTTAQREAARWMLGYIPQTIGKTAPIPQACAALIPALSRPVLDATEAGALAFLAEGLLRTTRFVEHLDGTDRAPEVPTLHRLELEHYEAVRDLAARLGVDVAAVERWRRETRTGGTPLPAGYVDLEAKGLKA